jgi:aspartate aminotransferase
MLVSENMRKIGEGGSAIRRLFEQGTILKKKYGKDNVFDFSIGNPTVPPTKEFKEALKKLANDDNTYHGYTSNAGLPNVREKIAEITSREQSVNVDWNNVIITCGAAAAMNVILKVILNPGDNVILIAPYFMEYVYYTQNHGGIANIVNSADDFTIDADAIAKAINSKTKAVIINSPNNPTGKVYSSENLEKLAKILSECGHDIYLISDEPYRHIVYNDVKIPKIFQIYENSIVVNSCSKNMSIPGERIGWIVLNSSLRELSNYCVTANRILGFINAPTMMQQVIAASIDSKIDSRIYENKKNIFLKMLQELGYKVIEPDGTFYLFVKSPLEDDEKFCNLLLKSNILCVPAKSFGTGGYFRIAYCCDDSVIINSKKGFENAIRSGN